MANQVPFWYNKRTEKFIPAGFHHGTWLQENEALPDGNPKKVDLGIPDNVSEQIVKYTGDPHDIRIIALDYGLARVDLKQGEITMETKGLSTIDLFNFWKFAEKESGPYTFITIHDLLNNNNQYMPFNEFDQKMEKDPELILRPSRIFTKKIFNLFKFTSRVAKWKH